MIHSRERPTALKIIQLPTSLKKNQASGSLQKSDLIAHVDVGLLADVRFDGSTNALFDKPANKAGSII